MFVECVLQILQALTVLHAAGIVHRDLKPANIMVEASPAGPTAKIMDFGLAHMAAGARLTQSDVVLGTPLYMAPELLTGSDPDPRVDLYSLGMILYEAWGGELPGKPGGHLAAFLMALLNWKPRQLCH